MQCKKKMLHARIQKIKNTLECPNYHSDLEWFKNYILCSYCNSNFSIVTEVPIFYKYELQNTSDSKFQAEQMFGSTFTAKLYNIGRKLISVNLC